MERGGGRRGRGEEKRGERVERGGGRAGGGREEKEERGREDRRGKEKKGEVREKGRGRISSGDETTLFFLELPQVGLNPTTPACTQSQYLLLSKISKP